MNYGFLVLFLFTLVQGAFAADIRSIQGGSFVDITRADSSVILSVSNLATRPGVKCGVTLRFNDAFMNPVEARKIFKVEEKYNGELKGTSLPREISYHYFSKSMHGTEIVISTVSGKPLEDEIEAYFKGTEEKPRAVVTLIPCER